MRDGHKYWSVLKVECVQTDIGTVEGKRWIVCVTNQVFRTIEYFTIVNRPDEAAQVIDRWAAKRFRHAKGQIR